MPDSETLSPAVAFTGYHARQAQAGSGFLAEFGNAPLTSILRAIKPPSMKLPAGQTHYGFVEDGSIEVHAKGCGVELQVPRGFYFSIPGEADLWVDRPGGKGIIVSARQHTGFLMMGWLELLGRLRYIDGCTDSLLIPPIKMGDPCLNLLYFPKNTDQTMHTHPSDRIGMVLSGRGECVTDEEHREDLKPGMLFCIHAGGRHKFRTTDHVMRVLAYHPDSDFGPTDEVHPMINRTMVDGVSASQLTGIHTI